MTNGMVFIGITTDPDDVSCTWLGSGTSSWGLSVDGQLWHNDRRIGRVAELPGSPSVPLLMAPGSNGGSPPSSVVMLGLSLDLSHGTLSVSRDGRNLGLVLRGLPPGAYVFPAISLYHNNDSVSMKALSIRAERPEQGCLDTVDLVADALCRLQRIRSALPTLPPDEAALAIDWMSLWSTGALRAYKDDQGRYEWYRVDRPVLNDIPCGARIRTCAGNATLIGSRCGSPWVHVDAEPGARPLTSRELDDEISVIATNASATAAGAARAIDEPAVTLAEFHRAVSADLGQFADLVDRAAAAATLPPSFLTVAQVDELAGGADPRTVRARYALLVHVNVAVDGLIGFSGHDGPVLAALRDLSSLIWRGTKRQLWRHASALTHSLSPMSTFLEASVPTLKLERGDGTPLLEQVVSLVRGLPTSTLGRITAGDKGRLRSFSVMWAGDAPSPSADQTAAFQQVLETCLGEAQRLLFRDDGRPLPDVPDLVHVYEVVGVLIGMALRCEVTAVPFRAAIWADVHAGADACADSATKAIATGIRHVVPIGSLPLFTIDDLRAPFSES